MIRIVLPHHLQQLANVGREVAVDLRGTPTIGSALDALEEAYPALRGTTRDQVTKVRRPLVRFFADGEDVSHEPAETPLPPAVVSGEEPFTILGAIAGG